LNLESQGAVETPLQPWLILRNPQSKPTIIHMDEAPAGSVLQLQKQAEDWYLSVRLPSAQQEHSTRLTVTNWQPYRAGAPLGELLLTK
jgi:hypothetical protein